MKRHLTHALLFSTGLLFGSLVLGTPRNVSEPDSVEIMEPRLNQGNKFHKFQVTSINVNGEPTYLHTPAETVPGWLVRIKHANGTTTAIHCEPISD